MTNEEAIKICSREKEYIQQALNVCADGDNYVSPDGMITALDYVEAMGMAISALMEQEERSKGCEYCNEILEYNKTHTFPKYVNPFCAVCGRRLEEV